MYIQQAKNLIHFMLTTFLYLFHLHIARFHNFLAKCQSIWQGQLLRVGLVKSLNAVLPNNCCLVAESDSELYEGVFFSYFFIPIFYWTQVSGVRSLGRVVRLYATCWDLTNVTLADEDTKAIQPDNANRAIQGNVALQVMHPGGQLWNQCKWRHLMTKFWINASCATW